MIFITERRKSAGLTQEQLSRKADVPQSVISELESGKKQNPAISTMIKLSIALGCKVEDLISFDE